MTIFKEIAAVLHENEDFYVVINKTPRNIVFPDNPKEELLPALELITNKLRFLIDLLPSSSKLNLVSSKSTFGNYEIKFVSFINKNYELEQKMNYEFENTKSPLEFLSNGEIGDFIDSWRGKMPIDDIEEFARIIQTKFRNIRSLSVCMNRFSIKDIKILKGLFGILPRLLEILVSIPWLRYEDVLIKEYRIMSSLQKIYFKEKQTK